MYLQPTARHYAFRPSRILRETCAFSVNSRIISPLKYYLTHYIFTKFIKTVASGCQILWLKCTKFDFGWGFSQDLTRELTTISGSATGYGHERGFIRRKCIQRYDCKQLLYICLIYNWHRLIYCHCARSRVHWIFFRVHLKFYIYLGKMLRPPDPRLVLCP